MFLVAISPYEFGAIGLIFILAAGLLKLVVVMVKDKISPKVYQCKAFENNTCPIANDWKKIQSDITEMYSFICGPRSVGANGTPRYYQKEDIQQKINEIYDFVKTAKDNLSNYMEYSTGKSEKISKDAMKFYHGMCSLLDMAIKRELPERIVQGDKIEIDTSTGKIKVKRKKK